MKTHAVSQAKIDRAITAAQKCGLEVQGIIVRPDEVELVFGRQITVAKAPAPAAQSAPLPWPKEDA